MLARILERVLQKYLGTYLIGVNKKAISLGVGSGNLSIQNVEINKEVLKEIEIPIILKASKIETLELLVPGSKLSSMPVEIKLKNVFLTLTGKSPDEIKKL